MEPPRFTLRTLMIAIALAALTTWGYVLWRRSAEFAVKAFDHLIMMELHEMNIESIDEDPRQFPRRKKTRLTASEVVQRIELERFLRHEERLYRKYCRAARFPWLSVSPDPPPPDGQ